MRRSPILGALLLPLVALACESDNSTEESVLAPPGPSFKHEGAPTLCAVSVGVVQKVKGHKIVVTGTDAADQINCSSASLPVHVSAGKGNDNVLGSFWDDVLDGGPGCDRVHGNLGDDEVKGGPGNDTDMSRGGCTVAGGSGLAPNPGSLLGSSGDDHIGGGRGNDFFFAGSGSDECGGGKGADVFSSCEECGDPDGDCP